MKKQNLKAVAEKANNSQTEQAKYTPTQFKEADLTQEERDFLMSVPWGVEAIERASTGLFVKDKDLRFLTVSAEGQTFLDQHDDVTPHETRYLGQKINVWFDLMFGNMRFIKAKDGNRWTLRTWKGRYIADISQEIHDWKIEQKEIERQKAIEAREEKYSDIDNVWARCRQADEEILDEVIANDSVVNEAIFNKAKEEGKLNELAYMLLLHTLQRQQDSCRPRKYLLKAFEEAELKGLERKTLKVGDRCHVEGFGAKDFIYDPFKGNRYINDTQYHFHEIDTSVEAPKKVVIPKRWDASRAQF